MRVTQHDLDWWLDLAPTLTWTFAKTMPDAPHSYVVRDKTLHGDDFERAVAVIRTFGEPGKFYGRTNVYLTSNGTKWWTMGAPIDETIIINSAPSSKVYGPQDAPHTATSRFTIYDVLSTEYDDRYVDEESLRENTWVWKLINGLLHGRYVRTLDVGCGTGLLLDMKLARPEQYVGVDPSQGMLNELIIKHPKVTLVYPMGMEEALPALRDERFGLTAALFGAASYLSPETITALPEMTDGPTVFMCYEAGYLPDYYEDLGQTLPSSDPARSAAASLGGTHHKLNRFDVFVVGA